MLSLIETIFGKFSCWISNTSSHEGILNASCVTYGGEGVM